MVTLGYKLSSEEHPAQDLITSAARAEESGFQFGMISDHFHPWVPSQGAAPGLQDLVAGGVEFVTCSIPEARALIDAGKVRALAIMDANPPALYPKLPTLKKELNSNWETAAWRVIAAPKGLPANVQSTLGAALKARRPIDEPAAGGR